MMGTKTQKFRNIPWLIFLFLGCIIFSCEQKPVETNEERTERILQEVAKKLEVRRQERWKQCKKQALRIAEEKVDSMLLAEAKLIVIDTIDKPAPPIKPNTPIIKVPKDSTPIEPLFEEIPDTIND